MSSWNQVTTCVSLIRRLETVWQEPTSTELRHQAESSPCKCRQLAGSPSSEADARREMQVTFCREHQRSRKILGLVVLRYARLEPIRRKMKQTSSQSMVRFAPATEPWPARRSPSVSTSTACAAGYAHASTVTSAKTNHQQSLVASAALRSSRHSASRQTWLLDCRTLHGTACFATLFRLLPISLAQGSERSSSWIADKG